MLPANEDTPLHSVWLDRQSWAPGPSLHVTLGPPYLSASVQGEGDTSSGLEVTQQTFSEH